MHGGSRDDSTAKGASQRPSSRRSRSVRQPIAELACAWSSTAAFRERHHSITIGCIGSEPLIFAVGRADATRSSGMLAHTPVCGEENQRRSRHTPHASASSSSVSTYCSSPKPGATMCSIPFFVSHDRPVVTAPLLHRAPPHAHPDDILRSLGQGIMTATSSPTSRVDITACLHHVAPAPLLA